MNLELLDEALEYLNEEAKFTFKDGKYPYYQSSITIKGKHVIIDEDDYGDGIDVDIFNKACQAIKKNYGKCLSAAAEDMFKHISKIDELKDKAKSPEDIKKKLKLECDIMYVPSKNSREYLADFHMSFDTTPSLDPHHLYTLYATVNKDYSVSCDDSVYDG